MPNQKGGLPPVTDVAIPMGLTLVAHWLAGSKEEGAVRQVERALARNYDRFVGTLQDLTAQVTSPVGDLLGLDGSNVRNVNDSRVDEIDLSDFDELEGGQLGQLIQDLSTPALLTLGAHWLAASDDEADRSPLVPATLRQAVRRAVRSPTRRVGQTGGMGLGPAVLKTLDDLIVPLGLMTGAHLLRSPKVNRRGVQRGGTVNLLWDLSVPLGLTVAAHSLGKNKKKRSPLDMMGGSNLPIIGDTYLGKWLSENSINVLTPQTLLPLGLIFVLYMAYRRYAVENGEDEVELSKKPNVLDMADRDDLARYAKRNNIRRLDPETPFPFALAMGPEAFGAYVDEEE